MDPNTHFRRKAKITEYLTFFSDRYDCFKLAQYTLYVIIKHKITTIKQINT